MNVLLVEPDRMEAANYSEALTRAGHSVMHAVSAQQAVHMADTQTPDVVVLELQLPLHNGVEFLYEFRSYQEWFTVPVVLHTYVPLQELAHFETLSRELSVVRLLPKAATSLAALCAAVQSAVPVSA